MRRSEVTSMKSVTLNLKQQPDLFLEFPVHRLDRGLAVLDSTLRELPGVLIDALAPKHLVALVREDDAYIGTVPVLVEHGQTALR